MADEKIIPIDETERSNSRIRYAVVLERDGRQVQFRGINQGGR